jgi:hypothetical protein
VAHAEGAEVQERGSDVQHMVRVATADGYRIMQRRYDRETDTFTEVSPPSEEE